MESVSLVSSIKQRVLLTGDGKRWVKNGWSSGQPVYQLQRIVNNSPSVAVHQGAMESANASDWVSPAQHCKIANVSRTNAKHCPQ